MSEMDPKVKSWKEKISHEMFEYLINVVYLTLVFASFTQYRRLLLAAHGIIYTNYWVALIQALILGKVIMIGAMFQLGRGLEQKPLIYSALYKSVVFSFLIIGFTIVEHAVKGLWNGIGLSGGLADFTEKGVHELLAGTLVVFVALVPFFAMKELGRVLGKDKMWSLFFKGPDRP